VQLAQAVKFAVMFAFSSCGYCRTGVDIHNVSDLQLGHHKPDRRQ
jgi:hypothetical protein